MSPRYRIEYAPKAKAELTAIHDYIAQDSAQNAANMIEKILHAIDGLDTFPMRRVVQEPSKRLPYPVRVLPVPPYLVFFRVLERDAVVQIMRIRHGARRPLKRIF
jgi:plasmid stabilization system protein ParE